MNNFNISFKLHCKCDFSICNIISNMCFISGNLFNILCFLYLLKLSLVYNKGICQKDWLYLNQFWIRYIKFYYNRSVSIRNTTFCFPIKQCFYIFFLILFELIYFTKIDKQVLILMFPVGMDVLRDVLLNVGG